MKPLHIRPEAELDIIEAAIYCEQQREGLGVEFRDEVDEVFRLVRHTPRLFGAVDRDVRRTVLRRFPYGVFYVDLPESVVAIAVLHDRRDPDVWRSRR